VFGRQYLADPFTEAARVRSHALEELSRPGLSSKEMECFQDDCPHPMGCLDCSHRGDDGSIAMAPPNRLVDTQVVKNGKRFEEGAAVEIGWEGIKWGGTAISRPTGNDYEVVPSESCSIDRIDVVAPAAMEEQKGRSTFGIIPLYLSPAPSDAGRKWVQVDARRHAPFT